jgi:hypothetical protein
MSSQRITQILGKSDPPPHSRIMRARGWRQSRFAHFFEQQGNAAVEMVVSLSWACPPDTLEHSL